MLLVHLVVAGLVSRPITPELVLKAMKEIPAECSLYVGSGACKVGTPSGCEKVNHAKEISSAIAKTSISVEDAVEAATYACYESANNLYARGDCTPEGGCKSFGAWQIGVIRIGADAQLAHWNAVRSSAVKLCANNPEDTRMAALASGHCDRGLKKVKKRFHVIQAIASRIAN